MAGLYFKGETMKQQKSGLWLLLDCFLVLAGIGLILAFFFLRDKTSLVGFSGLLNSFLGLEWAYALGGVLLILAFVCIVVFFLLLFASIFLRRFAGKTALPDLVLGKTLGFFASGFSRAKLWPWLLGRLREFSLVVYALFLAVVLMVVAQIVCPSGSCDSVSVYFFFWASSYMLIRGLYGFGLVQAFEKRLVKQQRRRQEKVS